MYQEGCNTLVSPVFFQSHYIAPLASFPGLPRGAREGLVHTVRACAEILWGAHGTHHKLVPRAEKRPGKLCLACLQKTWASGYYPCFSVLRVFFHRSS